MSEKKTTAKRRSVIDFQSEDERNTIKLLKEVFAFPEAETGDEVTTPPMLFLVWGEEKTGKTHLLCTMSEQMPVYVIDTEARAEYVQRKFKNVRVVHANNFFDVFKNVKGLIAKGYPSGLVVIDSVTDLHKFAQERVLEELGIEKLWPRPMWDHVYVKERAILTALKENGFHVGLTARSKDKYVGDTNTGQLIPNCFAELPYKADLVIQCQRDKSRTVLRNGWGMSENVKVAANETLPQIIDKVKGLP